MMNDNNNANQFTISYELLCLLRWLSQYDTDKLKKLVSKALDNGLKEEIKKIEAYSKVNTESDMLEEVHHSILEFFTLMESLLLVALNEDTAKKAIKQNLMPAIDHIDATACDQETVRFSVEKATTKAEQKPDQNAQQLLFEELLKRWKPTKKQIMH
ncbi:MAG: hypothetical protein ACOYT8_05080 [Candidatus Dependentiae bacterium]